jgi:uncharacterized protein (DUF169 family)
MGLEEYQKLATELDKYLKVETFPLAIKMIEKESEIPDKTVRPSKDMKKRLMICQGFGICKSVGRTMAFTAEDTCCMEGATRLGWLERVPYLEDGSSIIALGYAKDAEVARVLEEGKPALGPEYHYTGMVISPLGWSRVEPQMVLFYLNAARLARCLNAITGETGEVITAQTNGRGGTCIWGIIWVILQNKPTFLIPPEGEFRFAGHQDNEILLVTPASYLQILLNGLERTHKAGQRFPIPRYIDVEPAYPPNYKYNWETYKKYLEQK